MYAKSITRCRSTQILDMAYIIVPLQPVSSKYGSFTRFIRGKKRLGKIFTSINVLDNNRLVFANVNIIVLHFP